MGKDGPIIAALGDSLFEGWGLAPGEDAPSALERLLAARSIPVRVRNFGVSGETAAEGLRRVGRVLRARPALALVEFGANDFYQGVPPEVMEEHLAAMLSTLRDNGVAALIVGIRALEEYTGAEYKARFDPVFARLAARFGVPLVEDVFSAYLHDPALLLPDGIHPNAAGAEAIARMLKLPVLEALSALGIAAP
ncbi:MAG: GDSL-type esterase/lipase family protein [Desulfovibrionaceae bacterium]